MSIASKFLKINRISNLWTVRFVLEVIIKPDIKCQENPTAQRGPCLGDSGTQRARLLGSWLKIGMELLWTLGKKEVCSHLSVALIVWGTSPGSHNLGFLLAFLPVPTLPMWMLPSFEGHSLLSPWPASALPSCMLIQSLPTSLKIVLLSAYQRNAAWWLKLHTLQKQSRPF